MSTRRRDSRYLAYIRNQACLVSRMRASIVAHHVRMGTVAGLGQKPSDYFTVPLTDQMHRRLHQQGEASFWKAERIDPWAYISISIINYAKLVNGIEMPSWILSVADSKSKAFAIEQYIDGLEV